MYGYAGALFYYVSGLECKVITQVANKGEIKKKFLSLINFKCSNL